MKKIPLGRSGKFALVDDEDYTVLSKYAWHKNDSNMGYARTCIKIKDKEVHIYMHRMILNAKKGDMIDHKNGNTFDNQRANLRFCTRRQNMANRGKEKGNDSLYKGIVRLKNKIPTWAAYTRKEGKTHYLGSFRTPESAALAYDKRVKELYGEFARVNFPESR